MRVLLVVAACVGVLGCGAAAAAMTGWQAAVVFPDSAAPAVARLPSPGLYLPSYPAVPTPALLSAPRPVITSAVRPVAVKPSPVTVVAPVPVVKAAPTPIVAPVPVIKSAPTPIVAPVPIVKAAPTPVVAPVPIVKAAPVPVVVAAAPEPLQAPDAPMPSVNVPFEGGQFHAQDEAGRYSFGHWGGPNTRVEVRDEFGRTSGSFAYVNPEGEVQMRKYAAAPAMGFKVAASDLPEDTPAVAQVKAAHARATAAAKKQ